MLSTRSAGLALMLLTAGAAGCGDDGGAGSGGSSGGQGGSDTTAGETTGADTSASTGSGDTVASTGSGDTSASTGSGDSSASTGTAGLEVPGGPGDPARPSSAYPEGPFGIGIGSVVRDTTFIGYTRPATNSNDLPVEAVSLSDFYNPTGDEVFPDDGRAWAGQLKPKAVAISAGAVWCAPCNQEWREDVPEQQAELGPLGAEFLLLLMESGSPGNPATLTNLNAWVASHDVTAPAVLDPTDQFVPVFGADAFPQNVLVRTRDMTIVAKFTGIPDQAYWDQMRDVLEESP